jgi:hypothetical protein
MWRLVHGEILRHLSAVRACRIYWNRHENLRCALRYAAGSEVDLPCRQFAHPINETKGRARSLAKYTSLLKLWKDQFMWNLDGADSTAQASGHLVAQHQFEAIHVLKK